MPKNLPPLNSLLAFEAAARHNSFKHAAEELHQTPAAIAYQIKKLEDALSLPLFIRQHKGVELNQDGQSYLKSIQSVLNLLQCETEKLNHSKDQLNLKILTLHAIAEKWLMPRLDHFRQQHAQVDIEISASDNIDCVASGQLAIGFKLGDPQKSNHQVLMPEQIFPVCSPEILDVFSTQTDNLSKIELLVDSHWQQDWPLWLKVNNADPKLEPAKTLKFSLYSMVVDAAVKGMGLAMGHQRLIENELKQGLLVKPFNQSVNLKGYYFLAHAQQPSAQQTLDFIEWIKVQAQIPLG